MVDIEDGHHQLCSLCSPGVLTSPYPWRFFTNPAFFQLPGDCIPHSSVCILLSQDTAPPPTGPPCRAPNSELLPHPAPNLALPRSLSEAPCPKPHSSLVWNLLSSLAWWKVLLSHCSPNTQVSRSWLSFCLTCCKHLALSKPRHLRPSCRPPHLPQGLCKDCSFC